MSINKIKSHSLQTLNVENTSFEKCLFVPIMYIMLTNKKQRIYAHFLILCGECGNLLST